MATTAATLAHLSDLRTAVNKAINNVGRYQGYNGEMTTSAKNALLATVTTVPSTMQHASDCSICTSWDGSTS